MDSAVLAAGHGFVYPAPAAVVMAPLAVLPFTLAAVVWTVGLVVAAVASLWLVGVRDWRCFAAAFGSFWLGNAFANGTVAPLLMLGLALLWAGRDRIRRAPWLLAAVVVAKVFLLPLLLWLLVTRRLRTAALAAAAGLLLALLGWAAIGFAGLAGYPQLLARLASAEQRVSYSPLALTLAAGLTLGAGRLLVLAAAAALALLWLRLRRRRNADQLAFALALALALLLSPIVWPHYFALLLPVIGILHPRFGPAWLLPLASWAALHPHSTGLPETLIAITVASTTLTLALSRRPTGSAPAPSLRVEHPAALELGN